MRFVRNIAKYTGLGLALQELLYGFIMGLMFIVAAQTGVAKFDTNLGLVLAIIGMNFAWGFVDMILFTMIDRFDQRKYVRIVNAKNSDLDDAQIRDLIRNNLSGTLVDVLDEKDEMEIVRKILRSEVEPPEQLREERRDGFKGNAICFLLTVSTCIPLTLPLLILPDSMQFEACLWSSSIAAVFLFVIGYLMHSYTGINKWVMGICVSSIGIGITLLAMLMGGF